MSFLVSQCLSRGFCVQKFSRVWAVCQYRNVNRSASHVRPEGRQFLWSATLPPTSINISRLIHTSPKSSGLQQNNRSVGRIFVNCPLENSPKINDFSDKAATSRRRRVVTTMTMRKGGRPTRNCFLLDSFPSPYSTILSTSSSTKSLWLVHLKKDKRKS